MAERHQSSDPVLPDQLDFGGYPEWLVAIGASQTERTGVIPNPDDLLSIPMAWRRAVIQYLNIIEVTKPKKAEDASNA